MQHAAQRSIPLSRHFYGPIYALVSWALGAALVPTPGFSLLLGIFGMTRNCLTEINALGRLGADGALSKYFSNGQ